MLNQPLKEGSGPRRTRRAVDDQREEVRIGPEEEGKASARSGRNAERRRRKKDMLTIGSERC